MNKKLVHTVWRSRRQRITNSVAKIPRIYVPKIIQPKIVNLIPTKKPTGRPRYNRFRRHKLMNRIPIKPHVEDQECNYGHKFKKSMKDIEKDKFNCNECNKTYFSSANIFIDRKICVWFVINQKTHKIVINKPGCLLAELDDSSYIFYTTKLIYDNYSEKEKKKISRYLNKISTKKIIRLSNTTLKTEFQEIYQIESLDNVWPVISMKKISSSIFKSLFKKYEFKIDGNEDGITTINNINVGWKFTNNINKNNKLIEEISIVDPKSHKSLILEINTDSFDTFNIYRYIFQWCITKYWTNETLKTPEDIDEHIKKRTLSLIKKYHKFSDEFDLTKLLEC